MSDWQLIQLEQAINFGNGKVKPKNKGIFPIYGGNGILDFGDKFNYEGETIVIGRVGAYCGSVYYENKPIWVSDNALVAIPKKGFDAKFLFYFLKHSNLNQYAGGSSHPLVTQTLLNSLEFDCCVNPVLQERIAEVLSSLDDKIDLLQRQNKTLEEMAETLFRQWFESEESEPETLLSEFLDFLEGPGLRHWQYTLSGVKFINIRLIDKGELHIETANFVAEEEAYGRYKHFLLQAKDMVVSTSGTLGKSAIVRKYHLPLMLNTSVIRFRPTDGKSYSFMYQYLQSKAFLDHLETTASGSVQANFGPSHLKMMKVSFPTKEKIQVFSSRLDPLYEKINHNYSQIKQLEALCDTLLPKLMSGAVRVESK